MRAPLELVGQMLDVVAPGERIGGERAPDSCATICCVRSASVAASLGRQRQRLVVAVGVQRLRAAEHRGQRLHRDAHDVVERLLRLERDAAGLRVKAQARARVARAEAVAHDARVHAPRRAELRDFLEQIVVRGEEERQPRRERRRRASPAVDRARRRTRSRSRT